MSRANNFSVLHVATALSWRGGEQQVVYMMEELQKRNVSQLLLCARESALERYCLKASLPFVTARKRSSFDISFAARLSRVCKKRHIDIIHTHDSHAHTFAVLAAVIFGCKATIIVSRRVDFKPSSGWFSRFKYNHPQVKRILCVSDTIKQMVSLVVKDQAKLVTVHSGIDPDRFSGSKRGTILHDQFQVPYHYKIIANISAIAPHKDYYTFLDTVALLSKKLTDTRYFVIGDGPEKENIHAYSTKLGLDKIVHFTGFRSDIPQLLPEVDVMLITSKTEGLGTTVLDAFACKVPVVATRAGGIPEIVKHGETGLLAGVQDPDGLAQQVFHLLNDDQLRSKLTEEAYRYLKNFTRESTAKKTLTEYLSATGFLL